MSEPLYEQRWLDRQRINALREILGKKPLYDDDTPSGPRKLSKKDLPP